MFKRFNKLASITFVASIMTMMNGCGLTSSTPTAGSEDITVTFSFWEPSTGRELETVLSKFVEEYKELHNNVTIKLISQSSNGYQKWIQSQFVSDNAPDIQYNMPANLNKQVESGYIVDISEHLNKPNPYNNTDKAWRDDFVEGSVSVAQYFRGENHCLPLTGLGLAYYYNKNIYKELGLEIPTTWKEMISNFKVMQQNDIIPVALMGQSNDSISWLSWNIATGLFSEEYLADPNLNYNGDNSLDNLEIYKAIDKGYYDITVPGKFRDNYKKYISYLEEYGKYCPNSTELDEAGAKALFFEGKAGHIFSGSWDLKALQADERLPFEVGVFPFPKFTTEDTPTPGGLMAIVDVTAVAVTNHALKDPKVLDAAVDFLKFITSSGKYAEFIEETNSISVMNDLEIDESFKAFQGGNRAPLGIFTIGSSKVKFANNNANVSAVSGEGLDIDYLAEQSYNAMVMAVERRKEKYPEYGEENNYDIDTLPTILGEFKPVSNE